MKQFKKLLALLLVLCVAGLPVFALAADETGDGQSTETVSDPPQDPAPEPPKEQPKEPDPEPVQPPTTNENPDPPVTNPENPPTTETTTETTTDAPTTDTTTDAPTTDTPTTDAPTTDVPTTDAPTTDAPTTDAPTTETSPSTETMEVPVDELLGDGLEMDEALMQMLMNPPTKSILNIEGGVYNVDAAKTNIADIIAEIIEYNKTPGNEGKQITQIKIGSGITVSGSDEVTLPVTVEAGGQINGGTYTETVTNKGNIQGGSFADIINEGNIGGNSKVEGTVTNNGTIQDGTYDGVVNNESGTISKGEFNNTVTNANKTKGIRGGKFNKAVTNTGQIIGGEFKDTVRNDGTITGGEFSGSAKTLKDEDDEVDEKNGYTIINNGTISGGEFTAGAIKNKPDKSISGNASFSSSTVITNCGKIDGDATFKGTVENYGIIDGGKYTDECVVKNGDEQKPDAAPVAGATPTPKPRKGEITKGTFDKDSKLLNCWTVSGATIDGEIQTYLNSTAENCTFSKTSSAVKKTGGEIDITYYVDGMPETDAHYYDYATDKLKPADDGNVWYYYLRGVGESVSAKRTLEPNATIGVRGPDYLQSASPSPAPTQNPATRPTTSTKPSGNGNGNGNSGISPWADPATSDWSDPEGEEEIVLGPEQSLADDYLEDGGSVKLDIMHNGSGVGTDYELIPIPATSPEPTATDGTAAVDDGSELDLGTLDAAADATAEPEATEEPTDADGDGIPDEEDEDIDGDGILNEEDEDANGNGVPDAEEAEEEIARIPGEADEEGNVPGMLYVRAKGLGTEERKLSLTFSQLERMHREQGVDVLLFRNGSATVSMNVSPLFEGNIAKLMELMHAWEYNGANFDDYDLSIIDFDAIQIAPVFTDEELREFKLEMSIAPAVPVGYTVQVNLCLGENSKEISLLLEEMGVTMHAQTVTDNVAVYYMNAEQERFLLETHEGVVPGVDTEIEGYEVLFDNGTATVLDLNRSVTDTEFAGLCASTGDTGTYYIGVLPSAQASAGPTDEEAEAEETPEPTEEPTPEPTATEEPEDLSMELVVDVPR